MLDIQKRRVQLTLFIVGVIALSMTAEKFREIMGDDASSKSGKFTFLNCFDMGSGTVACGVKLGVKHYVYGIRNKHVEKVRQQVTEQALADALKEGLSASEAAKQAQTSGTKAAKLASRQAKRILGPIISSGWDFFEAIYYGGTMTEGFLRGTGTLFGTYVFGYHGEQRFGKIGYFGGSHLGSWVGGRIGLMLYDVVNGISYMIQYVESNDNDSSYKRVYEDEQNERYENSEPYKDITSSQEELENNERAEDSVNEYESVIEDTESHSGWEL